MQYKWIYITIFVTDVAKVSIKYKYIQPASLVWYLQIIVYLKHHFDAAFMSRPSMFEDALTCIAV